MLRTVFITILVAIICAFSVSKTFAAANPFSDVPAGHWAYNAVVKLVNDGMIEGYGDGTFRGNKNITRYEATTIIARILSQKENKLSLIKKTPFTDVQEQHWAFNAVSLTSSLGINKGYDDHTFRGDRNITRYEMAQMFANFLKEDINNSGIRNSFSDVPEGHWASNAVIELSSKGVLEGYGDGTFRGNRNITRYEAATLISRVLALKYKS